MKRSYFIQTFAAIVCIGLSGCDTTGTNGKQLAHVAKDWSLVVRASQIIPVYPLTEDLLPGDVFLVQSPIEDSGQAETTLTGAFDRSIGRASSRTGHGRQAAEA